MMAGRFRTACAVRLLPLLLLLLTLSAVVQAQYNTITRPITPQSPSLDTPVPAAPPSPIWWTVTPSTTTAYGSLLVGNTRDRAFTVSNVGAFTTISGTVNVASPFSVVSGGSYTLAPGQSTTTTIRYSPTSATNHAAYVTFTSFGYQTRQVTGSAYTDPTPSTGTIVGQVTRSDTGEALNGIGITVAGPNGDIFGGSIPGTMSVFIGGQSGRYSITGLPPNAHYQVLATPGGQQYNITNLYDVAVVAGQTTTLNITMTPASSSPPALPTPVVLVRGLEPSPFMTWDNGDYWDNMSGALLDQGFFEIWNCNKPEAGILDGTGHVIDGTKHIAYNAYMLWSYLQDKALQYKQQYGDYPAQVNIIAHSMGGLITRQALLNMDHFYFRDLAAGKRFSVKVGKVIMLGTPNAGTPLADIDFWPISDAVHDLTTTFISGNNGANNGFNASYFWPSGVSLCLYAGTGGAYSGNPLLKEGAFVLALGNGGDRAPWGVSDGAVPRPSVRGTEYLFGSSAYVNYFSASPVEDVTDLDITISLDHDSLKTDPATLDWVIAILKATSSSAAAQSAKFRPALQSGALAATSTNLLPMQPIEQISSLLSSGQVNSAAVISDAATTLSLQLLAHATDVVLRAQDPSGTVINSTTPASNSNVQYSAMIGGTNLMLITYTISNPATGVWHAVTDGSSMTETQASCLLRVFGDSTVSLLPQTILPSSLGQEVVVACALADLCTNPAMPVVNAAITATIQLPDGSTNNLTLFDDGWHNDGAPNDGVYAVVLTNVQQAGTYSIAYRATGTNGQGQALQRVATGGFSVSSGHGSLLGDPVYENLDTDGDGIADFLGVKCWVNPTVAGNYILAGDLVDASGTNRFSQSAAFGADGSGPTMATLIFDLAEIRTAGASGALHIENLQLFEVTSSGTAWLDAYRGSSEFQLNEAIVTVLANPTNAGAVTGNGTFIVGSNILISAAASNGWLFTSWNDGATNNPYAITVPPTNITYTANFTVDISQYNYTTNNGTITITGYTGSGGAVTIPDTINGLPVTSIGDYAFQSNTNLISVIIGTNVTSIGQEAFGFCTALTNVMIGTNVTSIGNYAFYGCAGLTGVNFPPSVTNIGVMSFYGCTGLTSVIIGNGVTSIGDNAFSQCFGLTDVTIPASVTSIGWMPFQDCPNLAHFSVADSNSVYSSLDGVLFDKGRQTLITCPGGKAGDYAVPGSVIGIGAVAFAYCTSLTGVTIPGSVSSIGYAAFVNCTGLTTITVDADNAAYSSLDGVLFDKGWQTLIACPGGKAGDYAVPGSVISIGWQAFDGCTSLTGVTIPGSVTSIADWAFDGCTGLTNLTIGNGVTSIGNSAFDWCTGLTSVTIGNGVTNIGDRAFAQCTSLTGVTIPASVTSIGDSAFAYCYILTAVYFQGNAPSGGSDSSVFAGDNNATVYFLPGTTGWGSTFGGRPAVLWNPQAQNVGVALNQFGFTITGSSNLVIMVEACTDLANPDWSPVGTNTLTGGASYFSDPEWTNYPCRFYRLRSP